MADNKPSRKLEFLVMIGTIAQEFVRESLRSKKVELPFSEPVNNYYLYHFGDYMNGFQIAMCANLLGEVVNPQIVQFAEKRWGEDHLFYKMAERLNEDDNLMNIISGVVGSLAVVVAETTGIMNTPDPRDILPGIAGAVTYMAVRYYVTKKHELKTENLTLQPYHREYH